MVWLPPARLEVVKLAVVVPPLVLKVPWPMLVPPSEKITRPLGLATAVLLGLFTVSVAVNVSPCPGCEGLTEEPTTVVMLALFTVWVSTLEVLMLKNASPR